MPVTINGVELTDADMEQELPLHADAPNPMRAATTALVLRRVLLDEAARLGLGSESEPLSEDDAIGALLARQAQAPEADEAACRRYYQANPQRFIVGELIEADHILFQVTPGVNLDMLRAHASAVLADLLADPSGFAEVARRQSNCPSAAVGGNLGQLGRGDTVPEFEKAVFALPAGGLLPQVLETRHGLHIVRVTRRIEGRLLPFEQVRESIASALAAASRDTAWRQYARLLVERADVRGIDLGAAEDDRVFGSPS
ncbi:peptidylprolyl isomerase [Achromobacter xylosoxidans]|uniref:peptidylprolyl isomerase n=1 Tax=Achromobacter TaxID=222 RepID=UPI00064DCDB0|nr:peptidylprolyl isomerase [Achromobacter xylosoxidans]KMJ91413.1 peptidylprolyl isomerase [Achromobacter xylosoxidans]MDC6160257.1 peptidylprolyl isomerase [Achromobacter xylosoxidans]